MEDFLFYTTWATSLRLIPKDCYPPINLSNNTLRQIIKISLGGDKFRIKLSNLYGKEDLEIKSISIAKCISQGSSQIDKKAIKIITFNKNEEIIIAKGSEIYSDIININLESSSLIAITIYFGLIPKFITGHKFSHTDSYIEKNNKINEEKFIEEYKITHWYFISNIDLISEKKDIKGIVCFGDSITDGRYSTINKQERWPDFLYEKIKNNNKNICIINQSLSGSFLTKEGINRFNNDVINIKGIKYVIILYGINDINKLNKKENDIINTFKILIKKAHECNLKIYGGTLLPFKGYRLYTDEKNVIRNKVNEWIRNSKNNKDGFDEVIDFDLIIRDEKDIDKLNDIYNSGDCVHLNSLGYKKMVDAFNDLSIFD